MAVSLVVVYVVTPRTVFWNRCFPEAVVVRVKARAVESKRWQRLDPAGGRWGLFGLHTVPEKTTEIVVTEVGRACGVAAVTALTAPLSFCFGLKKCSLPGASFLPHSSCSCFSPTHPHARSIYYEYPLSPMIPVNPCCINIRYIPLRNPGFLC